MKLKHKKERKLNKKTKSQITKKLQYQEKINKLQKGITLIALVITIIVLLILAGVSIATLTGDNGILTKAQTAKEETQKASEEEQRQLAMLNASMNTETYPYKDKNNKEVPIPAGFAPTGIEGESTVEEGFVITDENGNEFVWVPCGEEDEVKYREIYEAGPGTKWKEKYSKWTSISEEATFNDEGGNKESVNNNKGFYIGRYEAGLPKELLKEQDGVYLYDKSTRNTSEYTPVSKKGNPSWNCISYLNMDKVSEDMYKNSTSVMSQLIDSYAWDTTIEWLTKGQKAINATNSTNYGNYLDSSTTINGLYAEHEISWGIEDGKVVSANWTKYADKYVKGKKEIPSREVGPNVTQYEIATGLSEDTKTKNIYDLAGNMWEITTERIVESNHHRVARGGCFTNGGEDYPICHSSGADTSGNGTIDWGFRVVLYLQP